MRNRIIERIKYAYSEKIPTGSTIKDYEFIKNYYNNTNSEHDIYKVLSIAQRKNNNSVNLRFRYQIASDYNSNAIDTILVTTNNNDYDDLSSIALWDCYILQLTKDCIRKYLTIQEEIAKDENENFDFNKYLNIINSIRYAAVVIETKFMDVLEKNNKYRKIFDYIISQNDIDNFKNNVKSIFQYALNDNQQYSQITDNNIVRHLIEKLPLHIY